MSLEGGGREGGGDVYYKCNYSSFAVRTTSLHNQLKRKQQQYWRHLPDCLESVPMSCLSLSFNYRK